MKRLLIVMLTTASLFSASLCTCAQAQAPEQYLFAYFKEPANQGIYLAISRDGYHYEPLNDGQPWVKPEQAVMAMETRPKSTTARQVKTALWRLRSLQKRQPKNRLRGKVRPANKALVPPGRCTLEVEAPPPSGLLVSMVNCTFWVPLAVSGWLIVEKWQLTAAGNDAQPRPIVSVNPL